MTGEHRDDRPVDERPSEARCGMGPVARCRFVLRELRAWLRDWRRRRETAGRS